MNLMVIILLVIWVPLMAFGLYAFRKANYHGTMATCYRILRAEVESLGPDGFQNSRFYRAIVRGRVITPVLAPHCWLWWKYIGETEIPTSETAWADRFSEALDDAFGDPTEHDPRMN